MESCILQWCTRIGALNLRMLHLIRARFSGPPSPPQGGGGGPCGGRFVGSSMFLSDLLTSHEPLTVPPHPVPIPQCGIETCPLPRSAVERVCAVNYSKDRLSISALRDSRSIIRFKEPSLTSPFAGWRIPRLAGWLFPRATYSNAFWPIALVLLLAGCGKPSTLPEGRTPPNPSAPARYGEFHPAAGMPAVPEAKATASGSGATNRSAAPFYVLESELSPAILVHSQSRYLGLFTGLSKHGLGAPTHVGWSTAGGPRAFKNGESIDVMRMEENWVIVWFAGAVGWTNWDTPWVVFLQHRPASMKLDADGLHFTFSNRVDDVVLMPLYGCDKAPLKSFDFRAQHGLAPRKVPVKTWEWAAALPRDPLIRVRYWAGATRRLPMDCEESFSVNRGGDSIAFRWRFEWHAIEDDWKTKPLRLAPLSPTLALAVKEPGFPARFNQPPFDLGMFTPFGPMYGVPDVDVIEATFPLLQYVHETEVLNGRGGTNRESTVVAARQSLPELVREFQSLPASAPTNDPPWFAAVWAVRAAAQMEGDGRSNLFVSVRARLERHFAESGPGGMRAPGFVSALWTYAHFSEDWDLVRRHWTTVRAGADFGADASWAGFGPETVVSAGELASPAIALARLAYQAGDKVAYGYACARAVRELAQLWAKQRGSETFRDHQPLFSMEAMDGPVFLTGLDLSRPGWRIDGPKYPASASQRRSPGRWDEFESCDVARFFQDYLRSDVRRELEQFGSVADGANLSDGGGRAAALSYLRSVLLDERHAAGVDIRSLAATNSFRSLGRRLAVACCLLRLAEPVRYERLIASGPPDPFQASLGAPISDRSGLGLAVQTRMGSPGSGASSSSWPELGWSDWRTPAGTPWTFGQVKGARYSPPRRTEMISINRHTRMFVAEMP